MLPAHDVSGIHPISCLSLSQRKAITPPGQVQRLLGKSDGRGNLPTLHPFGPVTLIHPSALPTARPLKFQPSFRHYAGAVVCSLPESCLAQATDAHRESPLPPTGLASLRLRDVLSTFSYLVAESLPVETPPCKPTMVVI